MGKLTQQDVQDFATYLVGFGGLYGVSEEGYIITENDEGDFEKCVIKQGKKEKPLMIYTTDAGDPEALVLNPFKQLQQSTYETKFFISGKVVILQSIINGIFKKVIDPSDEDGNVDYKSLSKFSKVISLKPNAKTMKDYLKISENIKDVINIFYDKKSKTAQLQTSLFDKEFMDKFKGVPKKTWNIIHTIFEILFDTKEPHKKYVYTATVIGLPKADAIWHILYQVSEQINPIVKKFWPHQDLRPDIFSKYIDELEEIYQLSKWLPSMTCAEKEQKAKLVDSIQQDKTDTPPWAVTPPWEHNRTQGQITFNVGQQGPMYQQNPYPPQSPQYGMNNSVPPWAR